MGGAEFKVLLARAERACEESRRAGRNRVTVDRVYGKVIPFRPRRRALAVAAEVPIGIE